MVFSNETRGRSFQSWNEIGDFNFEIAVLKNVQWSFYNKNLKSYKLILIFKIYHIKVEFALDVLNLINKFGIKNWNSSNIKIAIFTT